MPQLQAAAARLPGDHAVRPRRATRFEVYFLQDEHISKN
jgi:hypothetical protein